MDAEPQEDPDVEQGQAENRKHPQARHPGVNVIKSVFILVENGREKTVPNSVCPWQPFST